MKKKRSVKIFSTILVFIVILSCSDDACVEPEPTATGEFQEILNRALTIYDVKGASAAVMIPGEEIWFGVAGESEENVAVTSDMLFCAGSVTKSYIAALILKLVEQGVLTLEDSLYQWLPAYPHVDSTITIRQLLNHTSGIADYNNHPDIWSTIALDLSRYWTPEEIVTTFAQSAL
jgi:D-alanyl-D-alanine carboxypeptidase